MKYWPEFELTKPCILDCIKCVNVRHTGTIFQQGSPDQKSSFIMQRMVR